VVVRLDGRDGVVAAERVAGTLSSDDWRCVKAVLEDGAWPAGQWSVQVELGD
jgi:hypothetical protein